QPMLYHAIKKHRTTHELYLQYLLEQNFVTSGEASRIESEFRAKLEEEFALMRGDDFNFSDQPFRGVWEGYYGGPEEKAEQMETAVGGRGLGAVGETQTRVPTGVRPHPNNGPGDQGA